jgi:hypothetical protein
MDSNGTNVRQLTLLNATSLTPKFVPNGNGHADLIMFSSNYGRVQQTRRPFSLFIANHQGEKRNGNNVKKVGFSPICFILHDAKKYSLNGRNGNKKLRFWGKSILCKKILLLHDFNLILF